MELNSLPKNLPVITTTYVVIDKSPIIYISYDEEGDFQIFSDEGAEMEKSTVVSLGDILEMDSSLLSLDINKGEKFYRENKDSAWQKI